MSTTHTTGPCPHRANYARAGGPNRTVKVGQFPPNRLGLHDMHGNVLEWTADAGKSATGEDVRYARGGSWNDPAGTASSHIPFLPTVRYASLGLRVARVRTGNPPRFTNALGIEFALVPKGKSWLGGGGGKPGDREVVIPEDFYLGVFEVTQAEWETVTGFTPSHFSRTGGGRDAVKGIPDADLKRFPVEMVSFTDIQAFLAKLNARANEPGWEYRLPTEAEWEYACRGGPLRDRTQSAYDAYFDQPYLGVKPGQANFKDEKLGRPCRVGQYPANPLGLHDMIGNVWELCGTPVPDPQDPKAPGRRLAGGFFGDDVTYSRAGGFGWATVTHRANAIGLRVARVQTAAPWWPAR